MLLRHAPPRHEAAIAVLLAVAVLKQPLSKTERRKGHGYPRRGYFLRHAPPRHEAAIAVLLAVAVLKQPLSKTERRKGIEPSAFTLAT